MSDIYSEKHQALAQKLRLARKNAGLTQVEAAQRLGVTQSWVSKVESGDARIYFLDVEEMAAVYGVDLVWFATGT